MKLEMLLFDDAQEKQLRATFVQPLSSDHRTATLVLSTRRQLFNLNYVG